MEKMNLVRGGSKLPPGFRFQPTDEEIVFQYLSRKTFSHPLPALLIPEFDVFAFDPWELPGVDDGEQDMYFFHNKESGSSLRYGRATDSGFWKATGTSKRIICSKEIPIVGVRRSFAFYRRAKHDRTIRTDWIMHEYYITLSENPHNDNSEGCLIRIGKWTLCRIFLKNRTRATEFGDDFLTDSDMSTTTSDSYSSSSSASSSTSDSGIFDEVSSM